jgi:hypothetical protein
MLRSSIYSAGNRGFPQVIRPVFKTAPFPLQKPSLLRRSITTSRSKSNPGTGFVFSSSSHASSARPPTILQRLRSSIRSLHNSRRGRYNNGEGAKKAAAPELDPNPTTIGGRLKKLSREYGWSAVGVYFLLSALDFPFCYLLVRYLGTDRIGEWDFSLLVVSRCGVRIAGTLNGAENA